MTSQPYNIVLIPSKKIADLAYQTSRGLSEHGTYFTLQDGAFYPHVSLYMVQLDDQTLDEVKTQLATIAAQLGTVYLQAHTFHQEAGYIDVEYKKDDQIVGIQDQVVDRINPLRDGLRAKDQERLKTATGVERDNLKKYGYRSIGPEFAPHLTFTRFIDESSLINIQQHPQDFSGDFVAIGLFEMGDNGTCVKKVWEIALS